MLYFYILLSLTAEQLDFICLFRLKIIFDIYSIISYFLVQFNFLKILNIVTNINNNIYGFVNIMMVGYKKLNHEEHESS